MRKKIIAYALIAGLTFTTGCIRSIPKDHQHLYKTSKISEVNEKDNTYKAKIIGIMDGAYYPVKVNDKKCVGIFDIDKATRIVSPTTGKEKIVSGEKYNNQTGVYVLQEALNSQGNKLEKISLKTTGNRGKKANIVKVAENSELFNAKINEKTATYNLPTIEFLDVGESYITKVKQSEISKNGEYYNFNVTPIEDAVLSIAPNGQITIISNNIQRPKHYSNKAVNELDCRPLEERIESAPVEEEAISIIPEGQ